jgi:hypothetical protein
MTVARDRPRVQRHQVEQLEERQDDHERFQRFLRERAHKNISYQKLLLKVCNRSKRMRAWKQE